MEVLDRKQLVSPGAMANCVIEYDGITSQILDLSFVRVIIETTSETKAKFEQEKMTLRFRLNHQSFTAQTSYQSGGDSWVRLSFDQIVPSARATLKSFLSPKKVGESIIEDWRKQNIRHFHGLNESELWFDSAGSVFFSYLDSIDFNTQFIVRIVDSKSPIQVGRLSREAYFNLADISNVTLTSLGEKESFALLGECRDIVTNFRPTGQVEYHLKQRLLKVLSDTLYSSSLKGFIPRPIKPVIMESERHP